MTKRLLAGIAFVGLALILSSCREIRSVEDYNELLNDPKNGCIITKSIGGIEISVKYQPPQYLLLARSTGLQKVPVSSDSLENMENNLMTFLVTLSPVKPKTEKGASVMNKGITSYQEYAERVMIGNFFMDQHITLYVNDVEQDRGAAIMENTYELSDKRNFIIVFANKNRRLDRESNYLFLFDDPFYEMGKVQFHFSGADLVRAGSVDIALN